MILSDTTIKKFLKEGKIKITPDFDESSIKMTGIRLHLDDLILVPKPNQIIKDISYIEDLEYEQKNIKEKEIVLNPGDFVLAATYEEIKTPEDILFMLDGRSTIARMGLTIHVTAAVIDGTFEKPHSPVLEIKNLGNFKVTLKYKDPIALGYFVQLTEKVTGGQPSNYRYTSNNKANPPNSIYVDEKNK